MGKEPDEYDYDDAWRDVYGDIQRHGPGHHHMRRILGRILAGIEYETVLDVGCGPGHNVPLLTKEGKIPRVDGMDVSEEALRYARSCAKGSFVHGDIQKESREGQWDLVFCSLLLEHVVDDVAAVRNLRKMTGHWLLVSSIMGDFEKYRAWELTQGHVRNYRAGELEAKLVAEGFEIVKVIRWGFPFYSPIVRSLQNLSSVGIGKYGLLTRILARVLTWVYYLNSQHRGDVIFILARATSGHS